MVPHCLQIEHVRIDFEKYPIGLRKVVQQGAFRTKPWLVTIVRTVGLKLWNAFVKVARSDLDENVVFAIAMITPFRQEPLVRYVYDHSSWAYLNRDRGNSMLVSVNDSSLRAVPASVVDVEQSDEFIWYKG
jgi:hypothetical protein